MIAFNEIKKHFSDLENRHPRLVLKEYLQYKILQILFSSKFGHKLIFMGGTSVRLIHGNDRFSEDIDIDNCGLSENDFSELMSFLQNELEKEGIAVEIRNTFKDVYHCYLKFPALLFNNNLSGLKDEKILIRVDSFCSRYKLKTETKTLNKADIFTQIITYPADIILSQKIGALLSRKRAKGRDVYDVVYLFSLTKPNYQYLKKYHNIDSSPALKNNLLAAFSEKKLSDLARDVEPFLIDPRKIIQVEKFNLWLKGLNLK
jgi:predicted nucleotidyltransferase component of viral defense system